MSFLPIPYPSYRVVVNLTPTQAVAWAAQPFIGEGFRVSEHRVDVMLVREQSSWQAALFDFGSRSKNIVLETFANETLVGNLYWWLKRKSPESASFAQVVIAARQIGESRAELFMTLVEITESRKVFEQAAAAVSSLMSTHGHLVEPVSVLAQRDIPRDCPGTLKELARLKKSAKALQY